MSNLQKAIVEPELLRDDSVLVTLHAGFFEVSYYSLGPLSLGSSR